MLDRPGLPRAGAGAAAGRARRGRPSTAASSPSSRCSRPPASRRSPRKFVGDEIRIVQVEDVEHARPRGRHRARDPRQAGRDGRHRSTLVEAGGTRPSASTSTSPCGIPLVGGKIEALIADMLGQGARHRAPRRRGVARPLSSAPVLPRAAPHHDPEHHERPEREQRASAPARAGAAPPCARASRPSAHVRVAVVLRRHEGLLDRARRGPAQQVDRGAGLVVGAGRAAAAEGLLPDDGAGRLVVDVEVAGREAQRLVAPTRSPRGPAR